MPSAAQPTSHSYFSQRLRLHYLDWGNAHARAAVLAARSTDHDHAAHLRSHSHPHDHDRT